MASERTLVFADLAGYTALTEAHGDEDAAQVATRFHDLARAALPAGTALVKTIGDGVMVVADDASAGIRAALAIAGAVHAQRSFPSVRIGIHAGPVVVRDGDYFGATVNIAARIAGVARGGEIVCTECIAAAALEHGVAGARPMGAVRLKNVAAPLTLYELDAGSTQHELRHLDPVCRMLLTADEAADQLAHAGVTLYFCSHRCAEIFRASPESYLPAAGDA